MSFTAPIRTITAVALIAVTLSFAACASESDPIEDDGLLGQPVETPEPEPVVEDEGEQQQGLDFGLPDDAQTGDVLDPALAERINSERYLASHPVAYELPNGEHVLIEWGDDLPEPVVQDVRREIAAATSGPSFSSPEAIEDVKQRTGRNVIYVVHAKHTPGFAGGPEWGVSPPVSTAYNTRDEAVAAARGAAGDSGAYVVLVFD